MSELESLNLEHTDLRTVALESPEDNNSGGDSEDIVGALGRGRLNELRLLGNPLKCDCHARDDHERHFVRSVTSSEYCQSLF